MYPVTFDLIMTGGDFLLIQTRSFCYVDDAVEGLMRVMQSDYKEPLNVGSDEMVVAKLSYSPA